MTRICLTMIVKDEAHVIRRCLESAAPLIDYWVIIDTGSTDGTQEIVRQVMDGHGIPGELHERPWVNFAHNRNEVLDFAQVAEAPDDYDLPYYALWIDADEEFVHEPPYDLNSLTADGYFLPVEYAGTAYRRLALTRLDKDWRWVGPVHEYLELFGASTGFLETPSVLVHHEGARSRDPETYKKDMLLLEAALSEDPDNTRLVFYYAQSLRDAGQVSDACDQYRRRISMGGWYQEVFISLLEIAKMYERRGNHNAYGYYLEAFNTCPNRAEPLVALARIERCRERYNVALLFAGLAISLAAPPDGLFVETADYTWRNWDEYSLAAWYSGNQERARFAAHRAAQNNPGDQRLIDNLRLVGG